MRATRPFAVVVMSLSTACASPGSGDSADATASVDATSATDAAVSVDATNATNATDATSAADATSAVDSAVDTDASGDACDDPGLVWHTGNKTTYESYPAPGSPECVEFSGCDYLGQFAACDNTMPESWVASHDIVAVFPLGDLGLHRLCLRAGSKTMVVTAIDTCGDGDCDGCCTENRGSADALIDIEKYTDQRFGVDDGPIEWADLGPGDASFDGCN
ncbi:MAG: hypothetical protein U1F43_18805 [Myxococcota bacterium]